MIQIKFSNKTAYTLIAIAVLLIGLGVVFAYRSGSQPSVLGHSAEELEVNISGTIMTLQDAITQGKIGGAGAGGAGDYKLCYCILCKEGDSHSTSGKKWKCGENGISSGASDDSSATQGCQIKIKLLNQTQVCNATTVA